MTTSSHSRSSTAQSPSYLVVPDTGKTERATENTINLQTLYFILIETGVAFFLHFLESLFQKFSSVRQSIGRMPLCKVADDVKIFYRTYGCGPIKVLCIIGLAATHEAWAPQIKGLTGIKKTETDNREDIETFGGIEMCAFDNRGVGQSSIPAKKSHYSTKIMAKDAIAVMDHLGWRKAHVFGHSMGAMIACKLAAMVPQRILSLALLNVTGGGYECFPKLDRKFLRIAYRFLRAKTPEQRAAVDLDTHYTEEYLQESAGLSTRREVLYQEYVKGISASGMQSTSGFDGQISACWMHKVTPKDIESMRSAGFHISVIHGRHDVIAQIYYARKLAERLHPYGRMVDLHGGHLVSHERTDEVNQALMDLIKASEMKISPHDWTNIITSSSNPGWIKKKLNFEGGAQTSTTNSVSGKVNYALLYLFGVFMMTIEYTRRVLRRLKPAKNEVTPMA